VEEIKEESRHSQQQQQQLQPLSQTVSCYCCIRFCIIIYMKCSAHKRRLNRVYDIICSSNGHRRQNVGLHVHAYSPISPNPFKLLSRTYSVSVLNN
jgi:hypothetical protein